MSIEVRTTTAAGNWEVLRARVQQGDVQLGGGLEIPTMPTGVATAAGEVRLAVGQNGEARLLLPLSHEEPQVTLHGGIGLSISVSSLNHKGDPFVSLISSVFRQIWRPSLER